MHQRPRRLLTVIALGLLLLVLAGAVGTAGWLVARHERTFAPEAVGSVAAVLTAALLAPGLLRRVGPGAGPRAPRGRRRG